MNVPEETMVPETAANGRPARHAPPDFSTRVIRELRGALDDEQERELTIAQSDILRRGEQLRLTDPETGIEYVLVPAAEFERLRP